MSRDLISLGQRYGDAQKPVPIHVAKIFVVTACLIDDRYNHTRPYRPQSTGL